MTREKFDEIVARLGVAARRNPRFYQIKVALLAVAGYVYLGFVLLLAVLSLVSLGLMLLTGKGVVLVIKVGWLVALFAWSILRGLWVVFPRPEGRRLTRAEAPELFAQLDEFRRQLRAPAFHEVLVTDEFNAAVVQVPRLGMFGFHRNYLLLGLPFLEALPVEEFKAVVAHEYGHLSSAHAKFSNWIYRQRAAWSRIVDFMTANDQGGWLILPFLTRFAPYFNAYTFVLARANEYEADCTSVRLTSARATASALLRTELLGQYLQEKVYPDFFRQAWFSPEPRMGWSEHFVRAISTGPNAADLNRWNIRATARKTDSADTHPALLDRIAAVGVAPELVARPGPMASDVLLGRGLTAQLRTEFDAAWRERNGAAWTERFNQAEAARAELAKLEGGTDWSQLTWDDAWRRASLVEDLRSPEDALPLFQQLRARNPQHAGAALAVGRLLVDRGDPAGIASLEAAMRLDWRTILSACDLLYRFHLDRGESGAAETYLQRYREQTDQLGLAQQERAAIGRDIVCEPHGLAGPSLAALREQLLPHKAVVRAWIVRKRVQHFPDAPLYVVGFKVPWYYVRTQSFYEKLGRQLAGELQLPGEAFVVSLDSNAWLLRRMKKVAGALIH